MKFVVYWMSDGIQGQRLLTISPSLRVSLREGAQAMRLVTLLCLLLQVGLQIPHLAAVHGGVRLD